METEAPKKLNASLLNNINNESKINNSHYVETNQNTSQIIERNNHSRNILQTQLNTQMNTQNITNIQYTREDLKGKMNVSVNQSV